MSNDKPTVLAFHAHPDDEALLTGGTLARAAAQGHRVVLVTATDGALGLASSRYAGQLADRRAGELRDSATQLGVARVEQLGYADSGLGPVLTPDPPGRVRFARADPLQAAQRLAEIADQERAAVLLSYDANGGYGHPDHVRVHQVGALAARLAGIPRVLEVCVSARVAAVMKPRHVGLGPVAPVTHVLDVRQYAAAKRAALSAHRSQLDSDGLMPRNLGIYTRLPLPVFARLAGVERFADPAAPVGSPIRDWIFD